MATWLLSLVSLFLSCLEEAPNPPANQTNRSTRELPQTLPTSSHSLSRRMVLDGLEADRLQQDSKVATAKTADQRAPSKFDTMPPITRHGGGKLAGSPTCLINRLVTTSPMAAAHHHIYCIVLTLVRSSLIPSCPGVFSSLLSSGSG